MTRSKLMISTFFVCVVSWGIPQNGVVAFHNGWEQVSYPNGCTNGAVFRYQDHPHTCQADEGYDQACFALCDGYPGLPDCYNFTTGSPLPRSSAYCWCQPVLCCEMNGCAAGHGGANWDPVNCAPPPDPGGDGCGCCDGGTPLIVSLRGRPITLSSAEDGVLFDFLGDGHRKLWAWPTRPDDAWLALDRNGNGNIDNAGELFGNITPLASGQTATNGYEALAELDVNGDGLVDRRDPAYATLRVWRDTLRNGNGDRGELVSLAHAGVKAIGTAYRESRRTDQWGNAFRYRGRALFDNAPFERPTFDVFLVSVEPDGSGH